MKNTRGCPKCQCNRILYIATVADRYGEHLRGRRQRCVGRRFRRRSRVASLAEHALDVVGLLGDFETSAARSGSGRASGSSPSARRTRSSVGKPESQSQAGNGT